MPDHSTPMEEAKPCSSNSGGLVSVCSGSSSGCPSTNITRGTSSSSSVPKHVPEASGVNVPNLPLHSQSHGLHVSKAAGSSSTRPNLLDKSVAHGKSIQTQAQASGSNMYCYNNSYGMPAGHPGQGGQYPQFPVVNNHPYSPSPLYYAPRFHAPVPRVAPPPHNHASMFRPPLPAAPDNWSVPQRPYGRPQFVYPLPAPAPVPPLPFRIQKQIEFYFSHENLVKDWYLRKHMDAQGWVPMQLVAKFPKVQNLARNTKFENLNNILEVMQNSFLVEVKDDKIRKRNGWDKWILPNLPLVPAQPKTEEKSTVSSDAPAQPVTGDNISGCSSSSAAPPAS